MAKYYSSHLSEHHWVSLIMTPRFWLCALLIVLLAVSIANSQSLEETIQQLSEDAAKSYVKPVSDGVGANLNTGWYQKSPPPVKTGFNISIGVVAMGTFVGEDQLSFSTEGAYYFQEDEALELAQQIPNWSQLPPATQNEIIQQIINTQFSVSISGPTVIGSEQEHVTVSTSTQTIQVGNQTYTIPGETVELDVTGLVEKPPLLPTAAPQLTIGTVMGTQLTFRYAPSIKISDAIGSMKYFGFGIVHNPAVWFKEPLPVDFALGYFRQRIKIGSTFEEKTNAFGIYASKTFGGFVASITPFGGFMFESSEMHITYAYQVSNDAPPIDVDVRIDGSNKNRFLLGVGFSVVGINLVADYNFGSVKTGSVSLMFGM